jgi:glyoxylase-like metal-dependent hydrolase (beta-lactamase superfamily II)
VPPDDIRLYLFDGGSLRVLLRNARLGQGEPGETIVTPVPWFLLTHPRGNVVVDGGNAPEVAVDAKAHWGAILDTSEVSMTPDQALVPSLERLGIPLESIRWVVQTHLHLDHTGAVAVIDRLPNAQVLVTRTEFEWAHAPDSTAAIAYCWADYVRPGIDWATLEETDDGYDVFGDGVLRCWRTPGHSPGHQSIEVSLPSGASFILAGDAANSLDHLEEKALPGLMISAPDTIRSVRKLRRLAWRSRATVIAGHDPDQWPALRKAPEFYS